MDEIVKKLDCLYQAAKDRQKASEGSASESYYRGQVVAYGRAVKAASQPENSAGEQSQCPACGHILNSSQCLASHGEIRR